MTVEWLEEAGRQGRPGERFRRLMSGGEACCVPGAYDGMSGVLARQAGFSALYLSGAALSASMALPDLGLITLDDVVRRTREICRAAGLPLIVDCDTGFGEVLNVMRTVRELEEAGAACIQIEDQEFPKKCGHLNDKRLVSSEEMCRKVAAAKKASTDLVICARTDAGAHSMDEAIRRANLYAEAGADLIFVEALTNRDDMRRVRDAVKAPLLANMTEFGRTPDVSMSEWSELGYNVVIFPVSAFRAASRSIERFMASLKANGSATAFLPEMMPRSEMYDRINYYEYEELDTAIARTVL